MGFRKDKQEALEWKKWLQRNRGALVECGLPDELYEDRRKWRYFLGEADLSDYTTGYYFSLEQLSPSRQRRLCDFLQAEFAGEPYDPCVLVVLKRMLGLPQRWPPPGED